MKGEKISPIHFHHQKQPPLDKPQESLLLGTSDSPEVPWMLKKDNLFFPFLSFRNCKKKRGPFSESFSLVPRI